MKDTVQRGKFAFDLSFDQAYSVKVQIPSRSILPATGGEKGVKGNLKLNHSCQRIFSLSQFRITMVFPRSCRREFVKQTRLLFLVDHCLFGSTFV